MEKIIKKTIPASEYRNVLMGFGYEKYTILSIMSLERSNEYQLTLRLKND
jgi:hypothetical protein